MQRLLSTMIGSWVFGMPLKETTSPPMSSMRWSCREGRPATPGRPCPRHQRSGRNAFVGRWETSVDSSGDHICPFQTPSDETAQTIGAVNTMVNDDERLTGYNTDWTGAIRALEENVDLAGRRVVVIGAGGAARAIRPPLQ